MREQSQAGMDDREPLAFPLDAVGADVAGVEQLAAFQVGRKLRGHRNHVNRVTGRAEHGANLGRSFFERVKVILTVVEDYSGKSVIDPVIDVIAIEYTLLDSKEI